jgi:3-hydroxyacyl-CoA dehydrogenase
VIGQSWTALFLAAGKAVTLFDPDPAAEGRVEEAVAAVWPTLVSLGVTRTDTPSGELVICDSARGAVEGAQFVQESVPECLDLKHQLYAEIETVLGDTAVVASSASGLTLTELQGGWRSPTRLVLGHPFNPPHLIPLVEVMGNQRTAPGVVDWTRRFYESIGKVTIEVKREVPGHVANRLQAALWREAIHLINEGVASVDDIDTAVSAGPGLRWAVMGPTLLFHLGAGEGGLAAFCERYADSFNRWWDDLGQPHLDQTTADSLLAGLSSARTHGDIETLAAKRDHLLTAVIVAKHA